MAQNSHIEWTEATWNPVTGCTKISAGCLHCYAERMAKRLQAMGNPNYRDGFAVRSHPHMLSRPLHWRKPRTVFVNSMSDLFHEEVSIDFVQRIFDVMVQTDWHTYQVLTKRAKRLRELSPFLSWRPHIWAGVTVERADYLWRLDMLREIDAHVKFVSFEPLLGPLGTVNLEGLDWVIVGGESGPGARPMDKSWVLELRDQCLATDTPFFFKQWGGVQKSKRGRKLLGRTWDQMPADLAPQFAYPSCGERGRAHP